MKSFKTALLAVALVLTSFRMPSEGAATVTASKNYVDMKTKVETVTNAEVGVVGYTVGTNTNCVFVSTNYVDSKIGKIKTDSITDGTNTIDAAGNVYVKSNGWSFVLHATDIASDATSEEIRSEMGMGTPIWGYGLVDFESDLVEGWFIHRSQAAGFYRGDSPDSSDELPSYEYLGVQGGPLDTVIEYNSEYEWDDEGGIVSVSGTIQYGMQTVVGKLALTNDIDYTTTNTQLVDTIEATAPAPGNYSAVSNAAMNARNATDIGVRGFPGPPRWKCTFFTVNGEVCIFDEGDGGWPSQNFNIYGYPNNYTFQLRGDQNQFSFVLSDNYSAIITNGPGYVIIGYTNTLAQVSQIPDIRGKQDLLPYPTNDIPSTVVDGLTPILFKQWYPDGSVTNESQFTQGLKYEFDTTNQTAYVKPFCNTGDSNNDNSDIVGDVVIPPYVESNGVRYVVSSVLGVNNNGGSNSNLTSINAPTTVKIIGSYAFDTCTNVAFVSLPSATSIGQYAFSHCVSLSSVSFPSATSIGVAAFSACQSLAHVSLPSATTIGIGSFFRSAPLSSVSLPAATIIENNAFGQCTAPVLNFGKNSRESVPTLGNNAFSGTTTSSVTFVVPDSNYDEWISANVWVDLYNGGAKFYKYSEWEAPHRYEIGYAICATNETFSNAVLSVGLNIDTNTVAAINALVEQGDGLPIGGATTVGVLILALAAAIAGLKRKKADKSELEAKLDSNSAAPAFDPTKTYSVGEHVTYNGVLYECSTDVTTAGAWKGSTNWTATNMTSPDATLDLMADGRLRLVSADGEVLWMQGYGLSSASSVTLSCDKVNLYAFASGTVTQAFDMPSAPSGKVGDFVLDVDNTANASASATATLTGAGTAFDVFTPEGVNISTDILTFAGGEQCELYFTMTAFGTAAKPAWKVVKQIVEKQEFGS